MYIINIRY